MARDWLADRRGEVAAEKILDAAGELFATRDVTGVGMIEIASAAGCSRATLYRYFENRDALHTAYVRRETHRLYRQLTELIGDVDDPRQRLIAGVMASIRLVRQNPALASWFSSAPIGGEIAERDEVITALTEAFLTSLSRDEPHAVARRARWLRRVMASLLTFPGQDDADERAMIEEFVVPIILPSAAARLG